MMIPEPEGLKHVSPGQRPGTRLPQNIHRPERAKPWLTYFARLEIPLFDSFRFELQDTPTQSVGLAPAV